MPQKLFTSPRHRKSAQRLFLREKSIRSKNPSIASITVAVSSDDRKMKEYTRQLREKQKVRRLYGVNEGQFRTYYHKALTAENTALCILQLLETRVDNVIYRSGFANTRAASRQYASHGLFTVNGVRVTIPSLQVKIGDVVMPRKPTQFSDREFDLVATWIDLDKKNLTATVKSLPVREDIDPDLSEQLIVEYYSR